MWLTLLAWVFGETPNKKVTSPVSPNLKSLYHPSNMPIFCEDWGRYHQEPSSQLITLKSQIFPVKNSNLQSSGLVGLVAKSSVFKNRQFWNLLSSHLRFWVSSNLLSSQGLILRLPKNPVTPPGFVKKQIQIISTTSNKVRKRANKERLKIEKILVFGIWLQQIATAVDWLSVFAVGLGWNPTPTQQVERPESQ